MKFVAEKGGKLSLFLKQEKGFSHKTLMLLKNAQGVLVNGAPVFMNYMLKPGDEVSLVFPPEAPSDVAPRDLPFCVVFEDEALLVVNKPPGQSVYPCAPGEESSLANAAAYYYQENGIFAPFRPVGRLDRGTSGLMLIAKNKHAATVLSRQRQKKTYYAVLQGELSLSRGGISLPLGPQEGSAICQGVDFNRGKSAATAFRILGRRRRAHFGRGSNFYRPHAPNPGALRPYWLPFVRRLFIWDRKQRNCPPAAARRRSFLLPPLNQAAALLCRAASRRHEKSACKP